MDAQQILDMLLKSGQELAEKGKTLAEAKLNIPEDPAARQTMLSGAGKGALAAGALAVLLGTGAGRKLTATSLKLGSLAAIGTVAYKAFQDWQKQQSGQAIESSKPVTELSGQAGDQRSKALLRAMIASAKADGHIDDNERALLTQQIEKLQVDPSAAAFITEELNKPLDVKAVAAGADSPAAAAEIYLLSRLVIDVDSDQERSYLEQLAKELGLASELVAQLEEQAKAA